MSQAIGLTILGGYLGAGKTTLLNRMLSRGSGRRLGVIVNDFGAINIDANLIESRDDEIVALANGCVCCSISGGFAEALTALSRREPAPEQVIIEASGVADPVKVARYASLPAYRLDGIVVLVDAETIRTRAEDKYVGPSVLRQLFGADLIVLNKVDLVSKQECTALRAWLHPRAPNARVLEASHGDAPMEALFGLHANAEALIGASSRREAHGEDYSTRSLSLEAPLSEAEFRAQVADWPRSVLRAKGIVHLREDPSRRHVFQLVGSRWTLTPDRAWGDEAPCTRIVLIGSAGQIDFDLLLSPLSCASAAA